jgi:indole-3-glycerol phosphate synthase
MDLGPLVPIARVGLGWGIIGLKRRRLDVFARRATEEAATERAQKQQLEKRVRVLEKIVTDGGLQTAAQIEALRERPASALAGEEMMDKEGNV